MYIYIGSKLFDCKHQYSLFRDQLCQITLRLTHLQINKQRANKALFERFVRNEKVLNPEITLTCNVCMLSYQC